MSRATCQDFVDFLIRPARHVNSLAMCRATCQGSAVFFPHPTRRVNPLAMSRATCQDFVDFLIRPARRVNPLAMRRATCQGSAVFFPHPTGPLNRLGWLSRTAATMSWSRSSPVPGRGPASPHGMRPGGPAGAGLPDSQPAASGLRAYPVQNAGKVPAGLRPTGRSAMPRIVVHGAQELGCGPAPTELGHFVVFDMRTGKSWEEWGFRRDPQFGSPPIPSLRRRPAEHLRHAMILDAKSGATGCKSLRPAGPPYIGKRRPASRSSK